ncbi:hypothetical protein ACFE04_006889 [Oxalis oulophora]
MHPNLFLLSIAIILIVNLNFPASLLAYDYRYKNCSQPFSCGGISDVTYPFWGGSRPEYCGLSGLELTCEEDDIPRILMEKKTKYRIIEFSSNTRTLTVVRDDYYGTVCPTLLYNSSIDFSNFYYASDLRNITIFYKCSDALVLVSGQATHTCNVNATTFNAYSAIKDSEVEQLIRASCSSNVKVTVFDSSAEDVIAGKKVVVDAINDGFGLQWKSSTDCNTCMASGGYCGFNSSLNGFACFCYDQPSNTTCSSKPPGDASTTLDPVSEGNAEIMKLYYISLFYPTISIFFFLAHVSFAQEDYNICQNYYSRGDLKVRYPFWGGDRPELCGHPGFNLSCEVDVSKKEFSVIDMNGMRFRVLEIDDYAYKLRIARFDLWPIPCNNDKIANNTQLDYRFFNFLENANENLTLFYGCNAFRDFYAEYFNCSDGSSIIKSIYYIKESLLGTYNQTSWFPDCYKESTMVPILKDLNIETLATDLQGSINLGFDVQYIDIGLMCKETCEKYELCSFNEHIICISKESGALDSAEFYRWRVWCTIMLLSARCARSPGLILSSRILKVLVRNCQDTSGIAHLRIDPKDPPWHISADKKLKTLVYESQKLKATTKEEVVEALVRYWCGNKYGCHFTYSCYLLSDQKKEPHAAIPLEENTS